MKAENPFEGHRWLGKHVEVTVRGFVVGEMANKVGDDTAGRVLVYIPIPGEPPDLHFGTPGRTFYAKPEDLKVIGSRNVNQEHGEKR